MHCELDNVYNIHHRPMGKEGKFLASHLIGDTFSFKEIHQRKHTLIIPVQHRRLRRTAIGDFRQIGVLGFSGF